MKGMIVPMQFALAKSTGIRAKFLNETFKVMWKQVSPPGYFEVRTVYAERSGKGRER